MINIDKPDWNKGDGLLPVIIQDPYDMCILMLGYMNKQALEVTCESGFVTFYSRSRKSLWTKGENSGNKLKFKSLSIDCDSDAILVMAEPEGPTCHTGKRSCFAPPISIEDAPNCPDFSIYDLQSIINSRLIEGSELSYTKQLFEEGIRRIAQKVGEEATEVVIAALSDDVIDFKEESADLLFHFIILLAKKGCTIEDLELVLKRRHFK